MKGSKMKKPHLSPVNALIPAVLAASLLLGSCASMASGQNDQPRQADKARAKSGEGDRSGTVYTNKKPELEERVAKELAQAKRDEGATTLYDPAIRSLANASKMCIEGNRLDLLQKVRDHGGALIAGIPLDRLVGDYTPGKETKMEDFLRLKQAYPSDSMSIYTTMFEPSLWLSDAAALALYDRFQTVVMAAMHDRRTWVSGAVVETMHGVSSHEYHVPLAEQLEHDARWVEPYSPVLAKKMRSIRLEVLKATLLRVAYPNGTERSIEEFVKKYPEVADYPLNDESKLQAALEFENAGRAAEAAKLYASLGDTRLSEQVAMKAVADLKLYLSRMPDLFQLVKSSSNPIGCLPEIVSWASPLYGMKNNVPREYFDAPLALQLAEAYKVVASSIATALNFENKKLNSSSDVKALRLLYSGYGDLFNYATAASLAYGSIPGHEADGDLFHRLAIKANSDRLQIKELRPEAAR
jgi:hypothetical protein